MDRRSFLRRGVFGGAVLVAGSAAWLGLRRGTEGASPTGPLSVVDPALFPVLAAVAARVVVAEGRDPARIAHAVDEALTFANAAARRDFNRVLALLESSLGGLLLRGSPLHFTELAAEDQDRALEAWRDSRLAVLRGAYGALRKLCAASHYAELENARALGYPGPPFDKPAPPPIDPRGPLSPPFVPTSAPEVPE